MTKPGHCKHPQDCSPGDCGHPYCREGHVVETVPRAYYFDSLEEAQNPSHPRQYFFDALDEIKGQPFVPTNTFATMPTHPKDQYLYALELKVKLLTRANEALDRYLDTNKRLFGAVNLIRDDELKELRRLIAENARMRALLKLRAIPDDYLAYPELLNG